MSSIKISIITLMLFAGCSHKTTQSAAAADTTPLLLGPVTRDQLLAEPYGSWFGPGYEHFEVDSAQVARLRVGIEAVDILIFMGTWCSDSKREVPRIYRVFDALNIPEKRIKLVGMDRNKETPEGLENGLDIRLVPTIIFYADGVELGRIIESPTASLLEDMQAILLPEDKSAR